MSQLPMPSDDTTSTPTTPGDDRPDGAGTGPMPPENAKDAVVPTAEPAGVPATIVPAASSTDTTAVSPPGQSGSAEPSARDPRLDELESASFDIAKLAATRKVTDETAVRMLAVAGRASCLPSEVVGPVIRQGLEAGFASAENTSQARRVLDLAVEIFRFGRTDQNELFAVRKTGPNVAIMVNSGVSGIHAVLAREFHRRHRDVVSESTLASVTNVLRGEAIDSPPEPVFLRVAPEGDGIVLDLGTSDGAVVVVTPSGWTIEAVSPVLFRRTALTGELPRPEPGGTPGMLRELLNVSDETWPPLLGWIVASLIPDMPHPILLLGGQQGTGKTTAARVITALFDASAAPIRSQPRDAESWAMSLANSYSTVVDNVSAIPGWWSDALCKAVTGDGWVRRMLYTNGDVSVLSFRRVIVLTSIDAGALRGDLGERLLLVDLEPISADKRRTERGLDQAFQKVRPKIMGAVLDILVRVLATRSQVRLSEKPRMADFAVLLASMDVMIGTHALRLYNAQATRIAEDVLDADVVGQAIVSAVRQIPTLTGTAAELAGKLKPLDPDRDWPKTPRKMAACLRRLAPALFQQGIRITPPSPTDKIRKYTLERIAPTAQPPDTGPGGGLTPSEAG